MTAFNALVDGYGLSAPEPGPPPAPDGGGGMTPGLGVHIADLQGTPPLRGDHNLPLHVGFLGIVALGVVVFLRLIGFRFSGAVAGRVGSA